MHGQSWDIMLRLVNIHLMGKENLKILDVGSYDVNGNYKHIFSNAYPGRSGWAYEGMDIEAGPNVDIVTDDPYSWPIKDKTYDVVISGQCLEHTEAPWKWVQEINRVCKTGGIAIIIAPWGWEEHRYPQDCWRIFPDGMRYLLSEVAGFKVMECGKTDDNKANQGDTWGVGIKQEHHAAPPTTDSSGENSFVSKVKSVISGLKNWTV
jgi:SAM-dependent methyltransferase